LTDLHSVYLEYLVALTLKRCGIKPHSKEIATQIENVIKERHFNTSTKEAEFEANGWAIAETFTLVDQHKIDPIVKGVLTIVEIQNLLECSDQGEILITVNRQCRAPYSQSWTLHLRPNINLFSADTFIIDLRLQLELESIGSEIVIKKIEHEDFNIDLFLEKMEMYKLFHSKS